MNFACSKFIENPSYQMIFLRILLFPLTIIYDAVTRFRNHLFDLGNKPSFEFETNVIAVGNLSVGGTGKTPMIEYLIRLLQDQFELTTLSRGYGRKTKGFRIAEENDSPSSIGDEPFQLYNKFKNIHVTVGEERALAIPEIIHNFENNQVILLDDAFQHRYVKPNLNILLSDYSKPFFNDFVLPSGRLRESRKGAERADIIIITKSPSRLDSNEKQDYRNRIKKYAKDDSPIFFTKIEYDDPVALSGHEQCSENIIVFTGVADNSALKNYVDKNYNLIETIAFADHHYYTEKDLKELELLSKKHRNCSFLTTEKDMVKLLPLINSGQFDALPLFYIPIKTVFLENGAVFDKKVLNSIQSNQ